MNGLDDRRIVVTRPLPADPVGRFAAAGLTNVWVNPRDERLGRSALLDCVAGASALISTPADVEINAELFDAAGDQLVIVSNYAVGVDNVDLAESARRGILVGHTPHAVTEPTADVAWMLMLAAARRAREGLGIVRSGVWAGVRPLDPPGKRVIGKTLLIVGAGRIGSAVARRALGWEMTLLYHSRRPVALLDASPFDARHVPLDEGLAEADFVSIHVPLTDETRHLFDTRRFGLMKPTAVLVNTARGPIVDEAALATALREGTIFAAGLDVFEQEPAVHPDLLELENVFLLPHWGSTTDADRAWMTEIAVENVIGALTEGNPPHLYPT